MSTKENEKLEQKLNNQLDNFNLRPPPPPPPPPEPITTLQHQIRPSS